jgi:quinol monooxygenase YgiN
MVHVIATITLSPGSRPIVITEFNRITPLVRAEDGCIEYQPTIDTAASMNNQEPPREDVLIVIEKWASLDALRAHSNAAHMAAYRERVKGLVKSVNLQILQSV